MTSTERGRQEAGTIKRALDVLREAAAARQVTQTRAVRLALWDLRPHCPDDWLVAFWEAAGSAHDIGRSQGLHASYNGIDRQVRAGRKPRRA